jgi:hypothetical protein
VSPDSTRRGVRPKCAPKVFDFAEAVRVVDAGAEGQRSDIAPGHSTTEIL